MSIQEQIRNLGYEITADIEHGECFYDKEMLDDFCSNLEKMKELAKNHYDQYKASNEDDDED